MKFDLALHIDIQTTTAMGTLLYTHLVVRLAVQHTDPSASMRLDDVVPKV